MQYPQYRKLSSQQKQRRISSARIQQKNRGPNPLGQVEFPDIDFIQFKVFEDDKKEKQIKLTTYRFPAQNTKALLFMFHGLNAHVGQGAHIGKYFAERGVTAVGFDHRGFGTSEGEPGYIHDLDQHLSDCFKFIEAVRKLYQPEIPHYAMGISMGGMTVYNLSLKNPELFSGVILMAPALKHNLPSIVTPFTNFLSNLLPKSTRLLPPLADKSNKNPVVVEARKNDKKCFSSRASLSTMNMILQAMQSSSKTFENYECPMLIIQGGLDKLVDPEVAFELYDKARTKPQDKKLLFYEEMWHGIWQEDEIWEILDECYEWLQNRNKNLKPSNKFTQDN